MGYSISYTTSRNIERGSIPEHVETKPHDISETPDKNHNTVSLEENRYMKAQVELIKGDDFEKVYNDYLDRRVAMAMRFVAEYVDNGGDVNDILNRLKE